MHANYEQNLKYVFFISMYCYYQNLNIFRFKDKTPTPLTNLDMLLEGTYRQVKTGCQDRLTGKDRLLGQVDRKDR